MKRSNDDNKSKPDREINKNNDNHNINTTINRKGDKIL
jgi:hypothetical protein